MREVADAWCASSLSAQRLAVYAQDAVLDPAQIYRAGSRMLATVQQHHENFMAAQPGEFLRPMRDANPDSVHPRVQNMRMPTGYFKVIYRLALDAEPARATGFLLPHSFENLNLLAEHYENMEAKEAFWAFPSRIDLIEETADMRFPGIPADLKDVWRDAWFFERRGGRNISEGCTDGTPQGILRNSTKEERIAACTDHLQ